MPPERFPPDSLPSSSVRGYKVAPSSFCDIEKSAIRVWEKLPKVADHPYLIDCKCLLEIYLPNKGFVYEVDTPLNDPDLRASAAYTQPQMGRIVIREDVYNAIFNDHPYARHTILHELGHIDLNHVMTFNRKSISENHYFYEDSEWQADTFAAALHVPLELCRTTKSIPEIVKKTKASKESVIIRINNLKRYGYI